MDRGDLAVLLVLAALIIGIQQIFGSPLPFLGWLFAFILASTILVFVPSILFLNYFDGIQVENRLVAQFSVYHGVLFLVLLGGLAIGIPPPPRGYAFKNITIANIVLLPLSVSIYSGYRVLLSYFQNEEPELRRRLVILITTNLVPYTIVSLLYLLMV